MLSTHITIQFINKTNVVNLVSFEFTITDDKMINQQCQKMLYTAHLETTQEVELDGPSGLVVSNKLFALVAQVFKQKTNSE